MNEAKFKVGEYVKVGSLYVYHPKTYQDQLGKVVSVRTARTVGEGYVYQIEFSDTQCLRFFERRLRKLPVGTEVLILSTRSRVGNSIPFGTPTGHIEHIDSAGYGVRTYGAYYSLNASEVQPVLTTQTSYTTQEETKMEVQNTEITLGTKVRATQDIKGDSGTALWLKGAVGEVYALDNYVGCNISRVQCKDDWFFVPKDQRQYWEVVSDNIPLTVCKPDVIVHIGDHYDMASLSSEGRRVKATTLLGKRVKIRKSSPYYADQGCDANGKSHKGQVLSVADAGWVQVQFDDGYSNSYPIKDVKLIKDKPKVPKFVPEAVTKDTPVGTKVRLIKSHYQNILTGAVGILERHDGDAYPRIDFSNDYWYTHYSDLETVHPDTAITKDSGDATL